METKIIICISDNESGHHRWTGEFCKMPSRYSWSIADGDDMASIYEIPSCEWSKYPQVPDHPSHWLSSVGEELCLGDYI